MSNYIIETKNLIKKYKDQIAVNQVSIHVKRGQVYGLLGRNGAGKTTLMKMLMNLVSLNDGQINLFGKDYKKDLKGTYQRIGSIIEGPGFYENLTGAENLKILAKLRGTHKQNSIYDALQAVGLEKESKKTYSNYSLGMKQRLSIAASIMHEPELLILDEPINGLDPIGIHEIRKYLLKLCREKGITILLSSHILSEIEQIADTIGVMNEGKLLEEIDMNDLHMRNRQYIEFEVSDVQKASVIIENHYKNCEYIIRSDNVIHIYSILNKKSELNRIFVEEGIEVFKFGIVEENLEYYFSNLIGGGIIG